MDGWRGTILRVDFTTGSVLRQPLDPSFARRFLGGRGFNSRILWETVPPGCDPFSPENVLCYAPGMLSGTPLALTGRLSVSTLSPLTGILGDGSGGGEFAWQLKRAGYDQLVITGRSSRPCYLWIDDDMVRIRDAASLWGHDTWETTDLLREDLGEPISVICTGPAGERLVRFASTIIDKYASAAPGSGAVAGSKNLKAIAVRGTGKTGLAYPDEFRDLARTDREVFRTDPFFRDRVSTYGSLIGVENWGPGFRNSQARWTSADVPDNLRAKAWKEFEIGRTGCHGCPLRCKNVVRIPSGPHAGEIGEGLEYEAIHWLGINSGILDPVAIMEMSNDADRQGMDVIGLGSVIAYAKELFEKGILTLEDTGGLSLEWEDAAAQKALVSLIAERKGFGDLLAEGMAGLARKLGDRAAAYCFDVKGVSRGVYPSGIYSLAHATSTRGADHLRGRTWARGENEEGLFQELRRLGHIPPDPAGALRAGERATTLADALGRCKGAVNSWRTSVPLVGEFPLWDGVIRLIRAATGVEYTPEELEQALDRIHLQEMSFNARRGIRRADDRMPQRPEVAAIDAGRADLRRHEELLTASYVLHGCDPATGIPTREELVRLSLKDVADVLHPLG
jgi:aldehyde:ferredoxin oxidoreductase